MHSARAECFRQAEFFPPGVILSDCVMLSACLILSARRNSARRNVSARRNTFRQVEYLPSADKFLIMIDTRDRSTQYSHTNAGRGKQGAKHILAPGIHIQTADSPGIDRGFTPAIHGLGVHRGLHRRFTGESKDVSPGSVLTADSPRAGEAQ